MQNYFSAIGEKITLGMPAPDAYIEHREEVIRLRAYLKTRKPHFFLFSGDTPNRETVDFLNDVYDFIDHCYSNLITPSIVTKNTSNDLWGKRNLLWDCNSLLHLKYNTEDAPSLYSVRPDGNIDFFSKAFTIAEMDRYLEVLYHLNYYQTQSAQIDL